MTTVIDQALKTYARLDVETGVAGASPEMLIVMLYDGAIRAVSTARARLEEGDQATKGRCISKAIGIIEEGLRGALDTTSGGEIAGNLGSLYEYMSHRLMVANLRNDGAMLDEVANLLRDLKSAWESLVASQGGRAAPDADAPAPADRNPMSYGKV